ncbi:hypothetical protein NZD89_08220 [Alicyclobacillus fastidiosus]|uniref:Uncharacterized protein n=1 Tax=Alicyclobacillus fastidiosus TaxID=392011 RepID=A0ABY6ZKG8_9BACL|nr:hypothetical protein [Alicyclobacillus fastidiosus]WAH43362.1 hypothetical protein NZD89_08220 [Alicyclobacillus fastidiosus]GMA65423.1 hypothetical protein GCM10025859_58630 [Alicyclobacillus fastidiosus]
MRDIHLVPNSYYPSENLEFPMMADTPTVTPNLLFYVRNHFEYPNVDMNTWHLTIEGSVSRSLTGWAIMRRKLYCTLTLY